MIRRIKFRLFVWLLLDICHSMGPLQHFCRDCSMNCGDGSCIRNGLIDQAIKTWLYKGEG